VSKKQELDALETRVNKCRHCPHLVRTRTQTVFGIGNPDAEFMFVGEAPGRDEDREGEPFVGRAGSFLNRLIKLMGFKRENVYIANVLKCRPDTESSTGNRKPEPDEMEQCLPYLKEQIRIIQPKVIIALGGTAMEGLFGEKVKITKERGFVRKFSRIPVVPTFHPAYVLRNPTTETRSEVWDDILRAMDIAGYDTSDRKDWVPGIRGTSGCSEVA
jgi:uracil-DNA glycosylase